MKRSFFMVLGLASLAAALFAGAYQLTSRICKSQLAAQTDDLAWLRQEFRLGDADMARIKTLHDGYLPQCGEMCKKIAAKKQELDSALAGSTNVSSEAQKRLVELGELRAQCQGQMLQHFAEVSLAMPPEQGRRYLAEMQRLTLGTHEQVEQTMSKPTGHAHGQD